MDKLKYIAIRVVIIALLFLGLNELYYVTFWKKDVSIHADTVENLWNLDPAAEAIYFGESSNFHKPDNEPKKVRISQFLDTLLPAIKVGEIDNSGLHSGTYLALLKNLPSNKKYKFVVVTMNLRSFGPVWINSIFETNLSKLERFIQPGPKLWNRFMISMNEYDLKTNEQRDKDLQEAFINEKFSVPGLPFHNIADWDKAIAWGEWTGKRPLKNQEEIALAAQYIKNFAFEIDVKRNPRIKNFDEIVAWGKENDCYVVFNILGENMEEANELVGETIIHLLKKNRDLLVKRYTQSGVLVVDNLNLVPDDCFVDRNWPTEHYFAKGKKIVAKHLAEEILKVDLSKSKRK